MSKRSRKSETRASEVEVEAKSAALVAKAEDAPPNESGGDAPPTDPTLQLIEEILDAGGGVLLRRDTDGRLNGPSKDLGAYERYAATTTIPDALRRQLALAKRWAFVRRLALATVSEEREG